MSETSFLWELRPNDSVIATCDKSGLILLAKSRIDQTEFLRAIIPATSVWLGLYALGNSPKPSVGTVVAPNLLPGKLGEPLLCFQSQKESQIFLGFLDEAQSRVPSNVDEVSRALFGLWALDLEKHRCLAGPPSSVVDVVKSKTTRLSNILRITVSRSSRRTTKRKKPSSSKTATIDSSDLKDITQDEGDEEVPEKTAQNDDESNWFSDMSSQEVDSNDEQVDENDEIDEADVNDIGNDDDTEGGVPLSPAESVTERSESESETTLCRKNRKPSCKKPANKKKPGTQKKIKN